MPVVGEAVVIVRVRSNNLRRDIRDAVNDGFSGADRDVDRQGAAVGDRFNAAVARSIRNDQRLAESIRNNISNGLREDRRLDLAAERLGHDIHESFARGLRDDRRLDLQSEALGERMAARMESALRENEKLRLAGERLNQQIADGVRRDRSLELAMAREARMASNALEREHRRGRPRLLNLFGSTGHDIASKLSKEFNLGIGAARMGPVVRSALTLATPSILSAAAAVGVAAAGALTAAVSSALLTGGLLFAAFSANAKSLDAGIETYKRVGQSIGTTIADAMADGFTRSATVLEERLLPAIQGPLERAGELFGNMFVNLTENTLTIPENITRLGTILDVNNHFIERFDVGLQGLVSSFLTLWAASKPMIDLVADRFAEFGQWAATALSAAEANGNLAKVMDNLTQLASALFDWIGKLGPAFGDWLLNLDVPGIITLWQSIGDVLGSVFDLFSEIAQGAGPQLPGILSNIAAVLDDMVSSGVVQLVAEHISKLLESFTGLVATLSDNPIIASVLAFGAAWALLGGIFSPLITLISSLASGLGALAAPVALVVGILALLWTQSENLRNTIGELATAIGGKFSEIWDKLAPKIQPLVDNVLAFGKALGDFLAPIIERIGPIFLGLLDIIGTVLGFIIDQVGEFFGFLADILSGDFEGAWEHLKQMFINLYNFIGEIFTKIRLFLGSIISAIWDQLVAAFTGIWQQITEIWNALWSSVTEIASTAWNAVWQFFTDRWNEIVAGLQEMGQGFVDWWNNLWAWVGEQATAAWNWITSTLSSIWQGLVNLVHFLFDPWIAFFQQLWATITEGVSSAWNAITSFLSGVWASITGAVTGAWNSITSFLSSTWDSIRSTAASIWGSIVGLASSIWNSITGAIQSAVSSVQGWLSGIWSSIQGAASSAWGALQGIASSIWNGIKDAIVQPIIDAYNAVTGWISSIKDAVSGAISWISGKVDEANTKLQSIIDTQSQAGSVTANMFNPDAVGGTPAALAALTALAKGGTTTGPTAALIGEAGPERVEPLDSQGLSTRDRAIITQIVNTMQGTERVSNGNTTVVVKIGEESIDNYIVRRIDQRNDDLAAQISRRRRR